MSKNIPFAIVYDFDGTLAHGNMQERNFIPAVGMTTQEFWREVGKLSHDHQADNILIYMWLMLSKAKSSSVQVRESDFAAYAKNLTYFEGILPYEKDDIQEIGWFKRINNYGKASGVKVEHFIVSSGIREMIKGTEIAKEFKAIFASSFVYDHHGVAAWPALAVNYTTKTQYLFRINKGCHDVSDAKAINEYIDEKDRPIPFSNMIYIGDGDTDIPCFRLVKDRGGYSVAVHKPRVHGSKIKMSKLLREGRVNFASSADYRCDGALDNYVKGIIDKVSHDKHIADLHFSSAKNYSE